MRVVVGAQITIEFHVDGVLQSAATAANTAGKGKPRIVTFANTGLHGLLARPLARQVASFALVALAITLFILNLRRTAERAGCATERLEQLERNDAIHRQMLEAASRRPRSRDDLLDRLRRGGF